MEWNGFECEDVKPQTLVETFDQANSNYVPEYVSWAPITLLTYPVSNIHSWAELQRYEETANSFTKDHDKREIEFSCNSAYEHKDVIDIDGIITDFACLKGTHLALCL